MSEPSKDNPTIDTSNVTVAAFNAIRNEEKKTKTSYTLGKDDTEYWKSPNFKVKVRAWTKDDKQYHSYFHSLSIDVNVDDFMGTAELKCPYDSDLMGYWEPIRQTVVIYGANRGPEKILFIGRVRGVKQDGYELVIEFQNYAWKFKQLVTQSYAKDNVLKKDGYTIMRLMFEALKIDSWVISEAAKRRLKQVGINQDGNLTVNGKEVKKIPDLIKRLKKTDPSELVNKNTINQKLQEKYLHNIEHINYTLKYEKPSPVMKKIQSQGNYSAGGNVYSNPYGSASTGGSGSGSSGGSGSGSSGSSNKKKQQQGGQNCNPPDMMTVCTQIKRRSTVVDALASIWKYQRDCAHDISWAHNKIVTYANTYPTAYYTEIKPCLGTMAKYTVRKNAGAQGMNGASHVMSAADNTYWLANNSRKASKWLRSWTG